MKESYLQYGKAFAERVGSSHGGNATIVGGVVGVNGEAREKEGKNGEGWVRILQACCEGESMLIRGIGRSRPRTLPQHFTLRGDVS